MLQQNLEDRKKLKEWEKKGHFKFIVIEKKNMGEDEGDC